MKKKFITNIIPDSQEYTVEFWHGKRLQICYLIWFISIAVITSCKKTVTVPNPPDQIVSNAVFSTDSTATSAVVGLYSRIMNVNLYLLNGDMSLLPALSADELVPVATNADYSPFYSNAIPLNSSVIETNLWRYGYNYIYQANVCLAGLSASTTLSDGTKRQLTGEMLFTRALCYFYLVNLFGDVPLETTTNYLVNESLPRTASKAVYQQMVTDLLNAQSLLSANYPTPGPVRPNKWAATSLLARIYLYNNDWKDAQLQSSEVINSGAYSLVSDLNGVFLGNSTEAVLQLIPVSTTFNTAEGATFIPSSETVKPNYVLSSYLLNSFETGDQRMVNWTKTVQISGTSYTYPYKFKVRTGSAKTEYNMILRYAELFLVRAEAEAQQGDITSAVSDINIIRQRAGLSTLNTAISQQQCLDAVIQENRIEFFCEWGHRWFDLNRTKRANAILTSEKSGWHPNDALYPIPSQEILENPSLTQNQGY